MAAHILNNPIPQGLSSTDFKIAEGDKQYKAIRDCIDFKTPMSFNDTNKPFLAYDLIRNMYLYNDFNPFKKRIHSADNFNIGKTPYGLIQGIHTLEKNAWEKWREFIHAISKSDKTLLIVNGYLIFGVIANWQRRRKNVLPETEPTSDQKLSFNQIPTKTDQQVTAKVKKSAQSVIAANDSIDLDVKTADRSFFFLLAES